MDPLTAIGLASNIISFIDFGAKLFNSAQQIYESASGATAESLSYESIAREMEVFSTKLIPPDGQGQLSGHDRAICELAKECKVLAADIQNLLEKTKPKDPNSNSRFHSFVSALAALKYDKQRGELQARLENCRSQLSLQLNYMTGSEIKGKLEFLASSSKEHSDRAAQLQRQVEELHDKLKTITSSDGRNQIGQLLQMSEDTFHGLINHTIIENLAFNDMYGRFDAVAPAHRKTFEWIFHGDVESNESDESGNQDESNNSENASDSHKHGVQNDPYCSMARESFLSWLSSGNGIFHISGKLGSGKSTLMKYLCEDRRTVTTLNEWAGSGTLVMASFFFWKPGSKLQKSMDGLLRALLYESLKSVPNLVSEVLPTQWNDMASTPWKTRMGLTFRPQDLRDAFDRLIDCRTGLRFCFFIDGLDEYEETFHYDYQSVIRKLKHWCERKSSHVKVCVSSREYNVFMNSLPDQRRIRMHHLTHEDMLLYVQDKIDFLHDSERIEELVETITSKADGIFLWVALVTKRLRDLNENGVSFQRIFEEIDQIPQGLEELFNHVLMSLDLTDKARAYKTFSIMLLLQRFDFSLPLLAYAFIDDDNGDPDRETVLVQVKDLAATPEKELIARARKMLRGYCKGLVEETTHPSLEAIPVMAFTHRSVPEFLQRFLKDTEAFLQTFEVANVISYILLKYLWAKDAVDHYNYNYFSRLSKISYIILEVKKDTEIDKQPFFVEEQLDLALVRLRAELLPEHDKYTSYNIEVPNGLSYFFSEFAVQDREFAVCGTFLLAAFIGNFEYLQWKLSQNPSIAETPFKQTIFFYCVYCGFESNNRDTTKILNLLLKTGFGPQTPTTMSPGQPNGGERLEVSVWQQIILFTLRWGLSTESADCDSFFWQWSLENGADPHFAVKIPLESMKSRMGRTIEAILIIGKQCRHVELRICTELLQSISSQEYPDPEGEGVFITLIDIINILNFSNKDTLLALIKTSTRSLQGVCEDETQSTTKVQPEQLSEIRPIEKASCEMTSEISTKLDKPDSDNGKRDGQRTVFLVYVLGLLSALLFVHILSNVSG